MFHCASFADRIYDIKNLWDLSRWDVESLMKRRWLRNSNAFDQEFRPKFQQQVSSRLYRIYQEKVNNRCWLKFFYKNHMSAEFFMTLNRKSQTSLNSGQKIRRHQLKSVHFKKTVARISFLSKLWYLLLLLFYWKVPQFWKKWGLRNCLLKMNGL